MITLIVGMPGSGKTTLASRFLGAIVVDDITSLDQLPDVLFDHLVVTDVNFCDEKVLDKALDKIIDFYGEDEYIDVLYFENDAAKCRRNVGRRADGRDVEGTIRRFENTYEPGFPRLRIHDEG